MIETLAARRPSRSTLLAILASASLVLIVVAATLVLRAQANAPQAPGNYALPTSGEIEERFGVRFTFLAVVADGGFIDLRYRIVDAGKARNFGHYTETSPMLIVEDTGKVIDVTRMGLHNHRVEPGRIYYVLFRNTANTIQRGDRITIQVGDERLEGIIAQ
ncbi:MAG: hypothetical protein GX620_06285 [Chloroflexi bacterium]|nr:hypothetical protein [Chloroflexota bacterium]